MQMLKMAKARNPVEIFGQYDRGRGALEVIAAVTGRRFPRCEEVQS